MRLRGVALVAGIAASLTVLAPDAPAEPRVPCEEASWTAGTTEWCDGTLVYRDFVYDDRGADTGALTAPVPAWETAGDIDHRDHGQSLNSTDLLALRIGRQGNELTVRFELNTLLPGDGTIAALAIDTDLDGQTGGGTWGPVALDSQGWDELHLFTQQDHEANVISGTLPVPDAPRIWVAAVVATGDGIPMNVAFRRNEVGTWWDGEQAAELADGVLQSFGKYVNVADLGRRHEPSGLPSPGLHERVFTSRFPIGEGVAPDGFAGETGAKFHFLGEHQPYGLYVPDHEGQPGAQLLLHGSAENHHQLVSLPGMRGTMGNHAGRVLVSPLGRGPGNSWVDWAARDALDALDDAVWTFRADPDEIVVSGYSMGGGGTMFLSTLFPDRFASAIAWNPFTGDCLAGTPLAQGRGRPDELGALDSNDPAQESGCPLETRGNSIDYLDNLLHVPSGYLFGAADEVVWANHALATQQAFQRLGYEHQLWLHAADHFTFPTLDVWEKEMRWSLDRRVVRNPQRVVYRTNAYLYRPDIELVPDGAYWVDDLRPIDGWSTPAGDMVVDLVSGACEQPWSMTTPTRGAGIEPVPWVSTGAEPGTSVHATPGRVIRGTLTNVASITIDRSDACFAPGEPVALDIETDPRTVITIRD